MSVGGCFQVAVGDADAEFCGEIDLSWSVSFDETSANSFQGFQRYQLRYGGKRVEKARGLSAFAKAFLKQIHLHDAVPFLSTPANLALRRDEHPVVESERERETNSFGRKIVVTHECLQHFDVPAVLLYGRRDAPPAEASAGLPLTTLGDPNFGAEAFRLHYMAVESPHQDQVIDLRNSAAVLDAQIVNDDAVFPVFPPEIDVVRRLLLALVPEASCRQLVSQILSLRF